MAAIAGVDVRVGERDVVHPPRAVLDGHRVADADRLRDRDQDARDHVRDRLAGGEADHQAEHCARREEPGREPRELGELAERERSADQQDGDEDEAADQAQASLGGARDADVGDLGRDPPPRAITSRSTANAIANATAIVTRAEIRSPFCCQKVWSMGLGVRPSAGGFLRENARMNRLSPARAVLLDALGTLVELEPPWPHLAEALAVEPDHHLVAAVRAEMAYYREHSHEGRDAGFVGRPARPLRPRALARAGPRGRSPDDDVHDPLPRL